MFFTQQWEEYLRCLACQRGAAVVRDCQMGHGLISARITRPSEEERAPGPQPH